MVLAGNPGKYIQRISSPRDIFCQPPPLCLLIPNVSPQAAVPLYHFYPQPPKELLCLGCIPRGHGPNSSGRLRVISLGRAPRLQALNMFKDVGELTPNPCVVRVTRFCDTGSGSPKLTDEGEDPNALCNHG